MSFHWREVMWWRKKADPKKDWPILAYVYVVKKEDWAIIPCYGMRTEGNKVVWTIAFTAALSFNKAIIFSPQMIKLHEQSFEDVCVCSGDFFNLHVSLGENNARI